MSVFRHLRLTLVRIRSCVDVLPFLLTLVSGGLLVGVMTRFPGVEQRGTLVSLCVLCEAPSGDLFHCLSECPAFSDLRDQWCRQCSIQTDSVCFWVRHPWLFLPSSSLNSDPRPCLVCWAGLRAFRLTVTLIPSQGSSSSFCVCFQLFSLPLLGSPQHLLRSCSAFSFLRSLTLFPSLGLC